MKAFLILFTICLCLPAPGFGKDKDQLLETKSPDGSVRVQLKLKGGAPVYTVQRNGQTIITDSKLVLFSKINPPAGTMLKLPLAKADGAAIRF